MRGSRPTLWLAFSGPRSRRTLPDLPAYARKSRLRNGAQHLIANGACAREPHRQPSGVIGAPGFECGLKTHKRHSKVTHILHKTCLSGRSPMAALGHPSTEQKLNRTQIFGALVYEGGLGAPHGMGAVGARVQTDVHHPAFHDARVLAGTQVRGTVHPEFDKVAGPQFAVETQVKQRQRPGAVLQLKPYTNGPDLLKLKWGLLSHQLAFVPGITWPAGLVGSVFHDKSP